MFLTRSCQAAGEKEREVGEKFGKTGQKAETGGSSSCRVGRRQKICSGKFLEVSPPEKSNGN
jgi:hypothetical protein